MNTLIAALTFAALAAAPAAAAEPGAEPGADARTRFGSMFVDWNSASRQSIEAEREQIARPADESAPVPAAMAVPGSRALGERVGDIVALGDCAEGERVARAAGDFALVLAVRNHCNARPAELSLIPLD